MSSWRIQAEREPQHGCSVHVCSSTWPTAARSPLQPEQADHAQFEEFPPAEKETHQIGGCSWVPGYVPHEIGPAMPVPRYQGPHKNTKSTLLSGSPGRDRLLKRSPTSPGCNRNGHSKRSTASWGAEEQIQPVSSATGSYPKTQVRSVIFVVWRAKRHCGMWTEGAGCRPPAINGVAFTNGMRRPIPGDKSPCV